MEGAVWADDGECGGSEGWVGGEVGVVFGVFVERDLGDRI